MDEFHFSSLSVIVPCLNEEQNIQRFDQEIIGYFRQFPFSTQFIFIDDGSCDETHNALKKLSSRFSDIYICHHPEPRGLGAALITALAHCQAEVVLTLDADLTFHPQQFPQMAQALLRSVDCVSGSAYKGGFRGVALYRRFLSMSVNRIYSQLLRAPVTSLSSLFRLYRRGALSSFTFECQNFDINAEIVAKLILSGRKVVDVPVVLTSRIYGESKINTKREIGNHLKLFLKILLWKYHRG